MCRMTDTGARWKKHIPLPNFGESERYWAISYGDETRYVREPESWNAPELRDWLKPLYAVRVTARTI